jgi:hypothetical protein
VRIKGLYKGKTRNQFVPTWRLALILASLASTEAVLLSNCLRTTEAISEVICCDWWRR